MPLLAIINVTPKVSRELHGRNNQSFQNVLLLFALICVIDVLTQKRNLSKLFYFSGFGFVFFLHKTIP